MVVAIVAIVVVTSARMAHIRANTSDMAADRTELLLLNNIPGKIPAVSGRVKLLSAAMKRFTAALHSYFTYLTLCSASPICL